jgi:hypothetical protein
MWSSTERTHFVQPNEPTAVSPNEATCRTDMYRSRTTKQSQCAHDGSPNEPIWIPEYPARDGMAGGFNQTKPPDCRRHPMLRPLPTLSTKRSHSGAEMIELKKTKQSQSGHDESRNQATRIRKSPSRPGGDTRTQSSRSNALPNEAISSRRSRAFKPKTNSTAMSEANTTKGPGARSIRSKLLHAGRRTPSGPRHFIT